MAMAFLLLFSPLGRCGLWVSAIVKCFNTRALQMNPCSLCNPVETKKYETLRIPDKQRYKN